MTFTEIDGQTVYFTSSEDLSATPIPEESIKLFMTSPPYWNLKDYGHENEIGQEDYSSYLERMNKVWQECYRLGAPNSVLIINVANRRYKRRFYPIAMDIVSQMEGWQLWDHVLWYIPNALPQSSHYMERLLDSKYENLLVFTKDGLTDYEFHKPRVPQKSATVDLINRPGKNNPAGRCIGNIIRIPAYRPRNIKDYGYHVAAYPEELVAFMLQCYTSEGDAVLDPFVGSGTTLKVARGMNRRGIGIEINTDYQPLIEKRIQEPFQLPDWKSLDILHSSTMEISKKKPRKNNSLYQQTDTKSHTLLTAEEILPPKIQQ